MDNVRRRQDKESKYSLDSGNSKDQKPSQSSAEDSKKSRMGAQISSTYTQSSSSLSLPFSETGDTAGAMPTWEEQLLIDVTTRIKGHSFLAKNKDLVKWAAEKDNDQPVINVSNRKLLEGFSTSNSDSEGNDKAALNDNLYWRLFAFAIIFVYEACKYWTACSKKITNSYKGKAPPKYDEDDDEDVSLGDTICASVPMIPFVIKYGKRVSLNEAHLTKLGQQYLKEEEVKVPTIYSAFEEEGIRYIVMEKINGDTFNSMWKHLNQKQKDQVLRRLRSAVLKLRQSSSSEGVHGIDGGSLYHAAMPTYTAGLGPFDSVKAFNVYLAKNHNPSQRFQNSPSEGNQFLHDFLTKAWFKPSTVFSHGDLSPFNIMIDKRGQVSIIDWETAGWWPTYMEYSLARRYDLDHHWRARKISLNEWIVCYEKEKDMIDTFFTFFVPDSF